jgi:hypothetical protein
MNTHTRDGAFFFSPFPVLYISVTQKEAVRWRNDGYNLNIDQAATKTFPQQKKKAPPLFFVIFVIFIRPFCAPLGWDLADRSWAKRRERESDDESVPFLSSLLIYTQSERGEILFFY